MEITQELQELIDAKIEEATQGLKAKNSELLGKLKEAQKSKDELAEAKEQAELQALEKAGNIDELKKQLEEKFSSQIAAEKQKATDLDAKLKKLVIEDGLTSALVKANVQKDLIDAAKALFKTTKTIELTDDMTAKIDGDNLSDAVVKWAQSDQGKAFVAAPVNTGGGAKGASEAGKASGKSITRTDFEALSPIARSEYMKSGGTVTD